MVSGGGKDRVKLNIGGIHFHTNKSTLTKFDGFFKTIISARSENTKNIFIDRPPRHFGVILNFMRDGEMRYPTSERDRKEIEMEAQFYLNTPILLPQRTVNLNVGGTIFQTTLPTLTKFDGFFKTMLESDVPPETDENGAIFIDRDPKHFRFILNYMRDGFVNIPNSKADVQEIQIEAQYYLLDSLVKLCDPKMTILKQHKSFFKRLSDEIVSVYDNSSKKNNLFQIMPSGNMVKLNIGGTVFQTTKSTLTRFDGFFKAMLETDIPLEKDETGAIFIDRSPKHFELILNYMRDGFVNVSDSKADIQEIQAEAQFYLLDGLVEVCKSKIPEELPVKLPIIENDAHLLNLIASSEITGKRVLVIYKNIAGKINDSEPNFDIKNFMKKHKNNYDIWFRALNSTDGEDSHYRIFGKPASAGATGPLATLEKALERTVQRRLRAVNQLEVNIHIDCR